MSAVIMKIGVIGTGNVGKALAKGFSKGGHEIKLGSRHPSKTDVPKSCVIDEPRAVVKWSELTALAVPHSSTKDAIMSIGPETFAGKIVLDVTNALGPGMELAIGCTTSAAEEIAQMLPKARVVKAFNTVFAPNQSTGSIGGQQLTLFVAGDDLTAKQAVMKLGEEIGFESVDAGPLKAARYLEPMGVEMIKLGLVQKMGTSIGYKLVRDRH